jgi:hypothetical protein
MDTRRPATLPQNALPRPLKIFLTVFLLFTAATWISCLIHFRLGHSQAYSSPFIHKSWDRFTDYRTYYTRFTLFFGKREFFAHINHRDFSYFSYPAAGAFVYWTFYHLWHYIVAYLVLGIGWACALAWALFRLLQKRGVGRSSAAALVLIVLAGAFPFDFMIERGNIELVLWILVFYGLFFCIRGRDNLAAVILGVAASIKIFPVIFCGILLYRRKYGALALALGTAVVADLLATWFAGPTFLIAFHGFNQTVTNYQQSYSVPARVADVGMDHSFFAFAKVVGHALGLPYQTWLHPYYLIAGVLTLVLYFGRAWRLPLANQILFIVIMAVGLPPNSFNYTLVYLYAPWAVLSLVAFKAAHNGIADPGLTGFFLCFALLFAPPSLFVRHDVRFGGQVQTLLLLTLLALSLLFPIADDLWLRPRNGHRERREDLDLSATPATAIS